MNGGTVHQRIAELEQFAPVFVVFVDVDPHLQTERRGASQDAIRKTSMGSNSEVEIGASLRQRDGAVHNLSVVEKSSVPGWASDRIRHGPIFEGISMSQH